MVKTYYDENDKTGEKYLKEDPKYLRFPYQWGWHHTIPGVSKPRRQRFKDPVWKYYLRDNTNNLTRCIVPGCCTYFKTWKPVDLRPHLKQHHLEQYIDYLILHEKYLKIRYKSTPEINVKFLLNKSSVPKAELKQILERLIAKPENRTTVHLYNEILSQLNESVDETSTSGNQNNIRNNEYARGVEQIIHMVNALEVVYK